MGVSGIWYIENKKDMETAIYKTKETAYFGVTIFEVLDKRHRNVEGKTISIKTINKIFGITYKSVTVFP